MDRFKPSSVAEILVIFCMISALEQVEKDKRFNTYGVPRNKSKQGKKADEASS